MLLKSKKGEGYIDVVVGIFLSIVVLALSLNIFFYYVAFNRLNYVADEVLSVAASTGETAGEKVNTRINDLLTELGLDGLNTTTKGQYGIHNLQITFEEVENASGETISVGSDVIENSSVGAVQRGDTVRVVVTAQVDVFSYGAGSLHESTITIYKTALSENFFKEE